MSTPTAFEHALPVVFLALMGLSMLLYVVLDGFDLGVGLLMHRATPAQQDVMVASIGPFWDANETWLVLGVGILLIAFPKAHGMVLTALYLPTMFMLVGLTLRGVAFEFRAKAHDDHKRLWNNAFFAGSSIAALSQGWMLGHFITGLEQGWTYDLFAAAIAVALATAYALLGATWLVMKTEGDLQLQAIRWAKIAWPPVVIGIGLIAVATPVVSATVRNRWFELPQFIALMAIPMMSGVALLITRTMLNSRATRGRLCWVPFVSLLFVFLLGFMGLAYSIYPYVVMDKLTLWQAASSPESLKVILFGVCLTVPAIAGYTVFSYRVFRGKATELTYG